MYPPITFLKPKYDTPEVFKISDVEYEVVDVTAQMPELLVYEALNYYCMRP